MSVQVCASSVLKERIPPEVGQVPSQYLYTNTAFAMETWILPDWVLAPFLALFIVFTVLTRVSVKRIERTEYRPDWSTLPPNPWIQILSYLDVQDRHAVSQTCQSLHSVCLSSRCLWRSLVLSLGDWKRTPTKRRRRTVDFTPFEESVLTNYARGVQSLDLVLRNVGDLVFSSPSFRTLNGALKNWRLKTFAVYWGEKYVEPVDPSCFSACEDFNVPLPLHITEFITKCLTTSSVSSSLETLHIHEWRWMKSPLGPSILNILKNAPFTDTLKHLKFSWKRLSIWMLMSDRPLLYLAVSDFVGKCVNLRTLFVPSIHVDDHFLLTLSQTRRDHLEKLEIEGAKFPGEIQPNSWSELLASCPSLEVHLIVLSRPWFQSPNIEVAFHPFVPVTKVYLKYFQEYADEKDYRELINTLPLFSKHLKSLSYCERRRHPTRDPSRGLLGVISRCSKLTELSFNGQVSIETIRDLASLERGWTTFDFFSPHVLFNPLKDIGGFNLVCEISDRLGRDWRLSGEKIECRGTEHYFPAVSPEKQTVGVSLRRSAVSV